MRTKKENAIHGCCLSSGLRTGDLVAMSDDTIRFTQAAGPGYVHLIYTNKGIGGEDYYHSTDEVEYSLWPVSFRRPVSNGWGSLEFSGINYSIRYREEPLEYDYDPRKDTLDFYERRHLERIESHLEKILMFMRERKVE